MGSCCSLVVEMADAATLGGALGVLLLGAIAVDTRGFDPSLLGTKYNGRDLAAGRKLLEALGGAPLPASPKPSPDPNPDSRPNTNPNPNSSPSLNSHPNTNQAGLDLENEHDVAVALRAAALPEIARVAGAPTVEALNAALLAARYDVRGLTAAELLRLDYKVRATHTYPTPRLPVSTTRLELPDP